MSRRYFSAWGRYCVRVGIYMENKMFYTIKCHVCELCELNAAKLAA